jgi:hypothetical protein
MRRYFVALLVALTMIFGMFYFEISTRHEVSRWAEQVVELSKLQSIPSVGCFLVGPVLVVWFCGCIECGDAYRSRD